MKKQRWVITLLLAAGASRAPGQTAVDLGRQGRLASGTLLPAGCKVGQIFLKTDAVAGNTLYGCETSKGWVAVGQTSLAGRGVSGAAPADQDVLRWNAATGQWEPGVLLAKSGPSAERPFSCVVGQTWLSTDIGTMAYCSVTGSPGTWSATMAGPQGPPGTAGNSLLSGSNAPLAETGVNGDFYVDMTASCLYGPKASGSWPGKCTSLNGVTSVSGTPNQVQSTGGASPVLSLPPDLALPGTLNKITFTPPPTAATLGFGSDNATWTFPSGGGTLSTHTGTLTGLSLMSGNGGADSKVTNIVTDADLNNLTLPAGGVLTAPGGIASGTSAPAASVCAPGTAGMICSAEGTPPAGTFSAVGVLWPDSSHRWEMINNNVPDLVVGSATADTLTHKTFDTAGSGNLFKINGTPVNDITGTGKAALQTGPTFVNPMLGAATAASINRLAITAPGAGSTLTIADNKTFTTNNTLTLAGTDGTTMTFPATSATIARTDAANTFTGVQTMTSGFATGSAPPSSSVCSAGTAGMICSVEGTDPTGTLLGIGTLTPTTAHRWKMFNNNVADLVVGAATTDNLTNKTFDSGATGNTLKIAGTAITGTGGAVLSATIASGTASLGANAIASGACASVVTVGAAGVAATDVLQAGFNGDPTAVVGYQSSSNGMLAIIPYPTPNNVNFKVCNSTAASITPGAITLNWRVTR